MKVLYYSTNKIILYKIEIILVLLTIQLLLLVLLTSIIFKYYLWLPKKNS